MTVLNIISAEMMAKWNAQGSRSLKKARPYLTGTSVGIIEVA